MSIQRRKSCFGSMELINQGLQKLENKIDVKLCTFLRSYSNFPVEKVSNKSNGGSEGFKMCKPTIESQEKIIQHKPLTSNIGTDYTYKRKIVWRNVLLFAILHIGGFYGFFLLPQAKILTWIYLYLKLAAATYAICAGSHRLYSHRAFKAVFGHRLVIILLQTMVGQNSMYTWVRDHRQHHKYSDTDADPHNANRGFFFSHMGWLMSRKHPLVKEKKHTIDMSDLEADPIVMFQYKYYGILYFFVGFLIPVAIPVLFWNESLHNSFFITYMFFYIYELNATWTINSIAHLFGNKPYDRTIKPVENTFASLVTSGEGYHNYHHTFPWDYRAAELGQSFRFTTRMIDWTARMGWSYDLRTVTAEHLLKRKERTGDLSDLKEEKKDDV